MTRRQSVDDGLPGPGPALAWVSARLEQFDPFPNDVPFQPGLKAFAELAIVTCALASWAPVEPAQAATLRVALDEYRAFLRATIERPIFAEALRRDPRCAYAFAVPYLCLRATGFRHAPIERTLAWLDRLGLPRSMEAVAHREWDMEYFLWKGGLAERPREELYYPRTVLGGRRSLIYLDDYDAYAVTHALFYLSDFGSADPALPVEERRRITTLLGALAVHYWRRRNWDLLGEVLISLEYLGEAGSRLTAAAAKAFLAAAEPDGATPADAGHVPRSRKGRGHRLADPETHHRYHTTFVHLLYLAACKRGDQA